jgi:hypothetical protein
MSGDAAGLVSALRERLSDVLREFGITEPVKAFTVDAHDALTTVHAPTEDGRNYLGEDGADATTTAPGQ